MIDLFRTMRGELGDHKINGQNVKARLEVSPRKKLLAKAAALFFKGLKEMKGYESKVKTFLCQTSSILPCG